MRKAALIALSAMSGSINCAAKPSISAFTLMSPSPSVHRDHQDEHALDRRVAPVENELQAHPEPTEGGNRQRELKERRRQDRACVHRARCSLPPSELR